MIETKFKAIIDELEEEAAIELGIPIVRSSGIADLGHAVWKEEPVAFKEFIESELHLNHPALTVRQYADVIKLLGDDPRETFRADPDYNVGVLLWGKGCFTGDTKVSLVDGRELSFIELVKKYGRSNKTFDVYSFDSFAGIVIGKASNPRVTKSVDELIEIVLDNGESIRSTPTHLYLLQNGSYKQARDLKITDVLMSRDQQRYNKKYNFCIIAISSIQLKKAIYVYDLSVARYHNFALSSGVFVHNSGKDLVASCMQAYLVYLLLCMHSPQEYFQFPVSEPIDIVNVAYNAREAKEVFFAKFKARIKNWRWLRERYTLVESGRMLNKFVKGTTSYVRIGENNIKFPHLIRANSEHSQASSYEGYNILCLSGETKIKLVDGRSVSIKELEGQTNFLVYSYDKEKQQIAPGNVTKVFKTQQDALVYKVNFSKGKSVKCTGDHLFLMRDGSYKKAKDFQFNDSLMPFYYQINSRTKGYEWLYLPEPAKWWSTHKIFSSYYYNKAITDLAKEDLAVHHKNFNKLDNTFENLVLMDRISHFKRHSKLAKSHIFTDEVRKRISDGVLAKIDNIKKGALKRVGSKRSIETRKKISISGKGRIVSKEAREKISKARKGYVMSLETKEKLSLSLKGRTFSLEHRQHLKEAGARLRLDLIRHKARCEKISNSLKGRVFTSLWKKKISESLKRNRYNNHKVVSVEFAGYADVYDMSVEKYHNFALDCGVFAHNCWIMDEASAFTDAGKKANASLVYSTLLTSSETRFGTRAKGLILSFPRSKNDFTVRMYEKALKGVTTESGGKLFGSKGYSWEIKPKRFFCGTMFDYKGHQVPIELKSSFDQFPEEAECRHLCSPAEEVDVFIKFPDRVYETLITREPLFAAETLIFEHNVNGVIKRFIGKKIIAWRDLTLAEKNLPRVVHIDNGVDVCDAALALGHGEDLEVTIDLMNALSDFDKSLVKQQQSFISNDFTPTRKTVIDAIEIWVPDKTRSLQVSLLSVDAMLEEICDKLNIVAISYDQWESAKSIEYFLSLGFNIEKHTITYDDFRNMRACLYVNALELPFYPVSLRDKNTPLVIEELLHLRSLNNKRLEKGDGYSKDVIDCVTGVVRHVNSVLYRNMSKSTSAIRGPLLQSGQDISDYASNITKKLSTDNKQSTKVITSSRVKPRLSRSVLSGR